MGTSSIIPSEGIASAGYVTWMMFSDIRVAIPLTIYPFTAPAVIPETIYF